MKPADYHYLLSRLLAVCGVLVLSACAGMALDKQIAVSQEAVNQAKTYQAPEIAPNDYNVATDKLARAQLPADTQETSVSMQMAQQAQADAHLAQARASAVRTASAAAEMERSNQALRTSVGYANQVNNPVEVKHNAQR